jgi:hypothetical protein
MALKEWCESIRVSLAALGRNNGELEHTVPTDCTGFGCCIYGNVKSSGMRDKKKY